MKSMLTVLATSLVIANFLIAHLLIAGSVQAQAVDPIGEQFQVNAYTTDRQTEAAVVTDSQGDFVVFWDSYGSDGTDTHRFSIQGQRYDSAGARLGGNFQVNAYTLNDQQRPAAAVDSQGNVVVVWDSIGSFGSDTDFNYSVQAQRYDSSGTLVGSQFQVNSYTTGTQRYPSVAADAQGNFVVVWKSWGWYGTDTVDRLILAQRYDSGGIRLGGEFLVNSYTTYQQNRPAVAVEPQGNFVVVWGSWGSYDTDSSFYSIQGQRYDSAGALLGVQFQVNTYTTSRQSDAAVAVDPQGNFVVVWQSVGSYDTDTSNASIQGQRYDSNGAPVGGEFQVNTYTTSRQSDAAVAVDLQGNFVVVWQSDGSYGTDTIPFSTQGQRYDSSGVAVGGEFQVNAYTTSWQAYPAVAAGSENNFMVVWQSDGSGGTDTDAESIQGQRFSEGVVHSDGFGSGDTSGWDSTQ